jgi:hypothetical protein
MAASAPISPDLLPVSSADSARAADTDSGDRSAVSLLVVVIGPYAIELIAAKAGKESTEVIHSLFAPF